VHNKEKGEKVAARAVRGGKKKGGGGPQERGVTRGNKRNVKEEKGANAREGDFPLTRWRLPERPTVILNTKKKKNWKRAKRTSGRNRKGHGLRDS